MYFPHISAKNAWDTEVCIINTSSFQTLTGNLLAYNDAGVQLSSTPISLTANARRQFTVGSDFTSATSIGYMILESSSTDVCGYMKFYIAGSYRGAIPATMDVNSSDAYIPHIASNVTWSTGLSLLNTTDSDKTLTIQFSNGTTKTVTLAAYQHDAFSIKSLFSGTSQPNIKSGVISNASGIVGLELFISNSGIGQYYLNGLLLKDDTTVDLYFPHIANFNTWWTGIVAYNPSSSTATLTITPYQEDGTALTVQTMEIQGNDKYIGNAEQLNCPSNAAWFHIASTQALSGFELFGTNNHQQLGGYTCVNISVTSGVFPKIEKSGWTGIALVNIQSSSASVTLNAMKDDGTQVATTSLSLDPHEKSVGSAQELFTTDISEATYISFSSTNPIVGFQLNGSTDNMLLDALPGM